MRKARPVVAIVMGSDSDLETMREATKTLEEFDVPYDVKILSAHRSPDATTEFAKSARKSGLKVIIAGAGGAAALAGVIAANTTLPVIGVPMETAELKGIDSLLSTVQMPSGVPVATVSLGPAGAKNAGILALEILGLADKAIENKLASFRRALAGMIDEKNKGLKGG